MGFWERNIVPRMVDRMCGGKEQTRIRQRVLKELRGEVVEVGFGSGLNLPHLPADVSRLYAIDPSGKGRELAGARLAESPVPVVFAGLDGQDLPLPDASMDAALSTWTICTIPDAVRALSELRRVLRPGGRLHFVEHGLHPDPRVSRWQHRLNPLQKRIGGGCQLNRAIGDLIREAGFSVDRLENYEIKGPRPFTYMYEGTAVR